jgi:hypothetical protein
VKLGKTLSNWENDSKSDDYGIRWVSPAPKSYSLKTKHNQNKFRFKGLIKNQETAQIVNHESMENMVRGLVKEFVIEYKKITRKSKTRNLVNKIVQKRFDYNFDKRVINKIRLRKSPQAEPEA